MQIDVCSVSQGDKRVFSTLTQALGLMADLDLGKFSSPAVAATSTEQVILGTEHLRWMGDARFMYGFLKGSECLDPALAIVGLIVSSCHLICYSNRGGTEDRQR